MEGKQPRISIIIPCYNDKRYLDDAINSVLASTLQDFEIIVVNDGSVDPRTISVLNALNHPKTRVINQDNQGLVKARNNGIKAARGEYFLPLDADDTIEPDFLEKAYWILEANPNLGFVYSYAQLFGDENYVWKTMQYNFYELLWENGISVCSLVRRKAWEEVGGYNHNMVYGYEDWDFWINLGKNGWYGYLITEPLFNHRKHGVKMTKTALDKSRLLLDIMKNNHKEIYYNKKCLKELKQRWPSGRFFQKLLGRIKNRLLGSRLMLFVKAHVSNALYPIVKDYVRNVDTFAYCDTYLNKLGYDLNRIHDYAKNCDPIKHTIVCIVPWLTVGGSERVLYNFLNTLDTYIYNVVIVTTLSNDHKWIKAFHILTHNIYHYANFPHNWSFDAFINKIIDLYHPHIAYLSNSELGYRSLVSIKNHHPELKTFDVIHNHSPHGHLSASLDNDVFLDKHIVISRDLETIVSRRLQNSGKLVCVPNGVDTDFFHPANADAEGFLDRLRLPRNIKIVAFIGRFHLEKNPLIFIEIARHMKGIPNTVFVMAGDGLQMEMAKSAIKKYDLNDKVRLLGETDQIRDLLSCASVLVNTSDMEGLSVTILEALAMMVPVVASNVGGNSELVDDGVTGFLIDRFGDVDGFVDKISRILENPDLQRSMGEESRKKVSANYSLREAGKKYDQLLRSLI